MSTSIEIPLWLFLLTWAAVAFVAVAITTIFVDAAWFSAAQKFLGRRTAELLRNYRMGRR